MRALMLVIVILCGCASSWEDRIGITPYYLYPGEEAPVEGPQFSTADYLKIQEELDKLWGIEQ